MKRILFLLLFFLNFLFSDELIIFVPYNLFTCNVIGYQEDKHSSYALDLPDKPAFALSCSKYPGSENYNSQCLLDITPRASGQFLHPSGDYLAWDYYYMPNSDILSFCEKKDGYTYSHNLKAWLKNPDNNDVNASDIICPNGMQFSSSQEKCVPACPSQSEMEKKAIEKCGSLNFAKNMSCNLDTGEVIIQCMSCSEIMQQQYNLCAEHNMQMINGLSCSTNSDGSNSVNFDKIALSNCVLPDSNNTGSDINNTNSDSNNTGSDSNNINSDSNNINSDVNNTDPNYVVLQNIYNINREIDKKLKSVSDNAIKLGETQKVGTLTIKNSIGNLTKTNSESFEKLHNDLFDNGKKLDKIADILTDNNGTIKNGVKGALNSAKNYIKIEKKEYVTGSYNDEFPTIKVNIFGKDIVLLDDSYRNLIPFDLIKTILYIVAGVIAIIICIKTF
jgi:hypothetical protein